MVNKKTKRVSVTLELEPRDAARFDRYIAWLNEVVPSIPARRRATVCRELLLTAVTDWERRGLDRGR